MSELKETKKWNPQQLAAQHFLAACKVDADGKVWKEGDYCREVLHINQVTLSDWKRLPGWDYAVSQLVPHYLRRYLAQIDMAQVIKARKGDTVAAKYVRAVVGDPVVDRVENKNEQIGELVIRVGE